MALIEALTEDDGELRLGHGPLTRWHFPLFLRSVQDHIQQFCCRLVAREVPPGPDSPAELGVEGLNRVGGVDDPADLVREGEEGDHFAPGTSPALADGGIALAPGPSLERGQGLFGSFGARGAVDLLERCRQTLAVLPGHKVHGVAQQMDDACLDDRVREHGRNRFRKALEAVDDGGYPLCRGS